MASQNKITISFSKEYQDVYQFLNCQQNASKVVCEIIRAHKTKDNLEATVEKVLSKLLKNNLQSRDDDLKNAADNFDF